MKIRYQTSSQSSENQIAAETNHGLLLITTKADELTSVERQPGKIRNMIDGQSLSAIRATYGEFYDFILVRNN